MAHGEVWIVPTAKDAETLEIALMLLDVTGGKFAAEATKFRRRNFAFAAEFFFDLSFDGEAVAIPAGDVRGVMARHGFRFDDKVLKDFVQTCAEMDGTGGIRGTIVENEKRLSLTCGENGFVKIRVLPSGELFWLVLRQTGFHGKVGFGEVEGLFQFEWFSHIRASANPLCTVVFPVMMIFPVNRAGNIRKRCNYVCYNRAVSGVSRRGRATNPGPSES